MPQDPVHKKTNLAPLYLIYKDVMENMRDHQFMAMNASVAFFYPVCDYSFDVTGDLYFWSLAQ